MPVFRRFSKLMLCCPFPRCRPPLELPVDAPPPPPPPLVPPPMPPGYNYPHLPPPPHGNLPPLPSGPPPQPPQEPLPGADLIPQPKVEADRPAVSTIATNGDSISQRNNSGAITLNFRDGSSQQQATGVSAVSKPAAVARSKVLKGGLTLVFDPDVDGQQEMSMEELRASQPRYQKMLELAIAKTS